MMNLTHYQGQQLRIQEDAVRIISTAFTQTSRHDHHVSLLNDFTQPRQIHLANIRPNFALYIVFPNPDNMIDPTHDDPSRYSLTVYQLTHPEFERLDYFLPFDIAVIYRHYIGQNRINVTANGFTYSVPAATNVTPGRVLIDIWLLRNSCIDVSPDAHGSYYIAPLLISHINEFLAKSLFRLYSKSRAENLTLVVRSTQGNNMDGLATKQSPLGPDDRGDINCNNNQSQRKMVERKDCVDSAAIIIGSPSLRELDFLRRSSRLAWMRWINTFMRSEDASLRR